MEELRSVGHCSCLIIYWLSKEAGEEAGCYCRCRKWHWVLQMRDYNGGFYGSHGNGIHDERLYRQNLSDPTRSESSMDPTAPVGQNACNPQASSNPSSSVLERKADYANPSLSNPSSSVPNQS